MAGHRAGAGRIDGAASGQGDTLVSSVSGGYQVVTEDLAGLATFFHDSAGATLTDVRAKVADLHMSGEQTGRCCREAGDAVQKALQAIGENIQQFSDHLQDTGGALDATVRNYRSADEYGTGRLHSARGGA